MQRHLAGCQRARAELVFETIDAISVARTIFQRFRHEKQSKATSTRRSSFGAGKRQNQLGGDIGTEPLFSPQFPLRLQACLHMRACFRYRSGQADI